MLTLSLGASAQVQKNDTTMSRTVVVENEYNPNILDAQKINVMPKVEPLQATQRQVVYDHAIHPATQLPGTILPVMASQVLQRTARPGYIRLGVGLPGNIDFLGNYRARFSEVDELNIFAQFNGNKGDRSFEEGGADWEDARFYQTRVGLDYSHAFTGSKLDLGAHLGVINLNQPDKFLLPGNRNLTSGDLHVGYASADDNQSIIYNLETNLQFFSLGRLNNDKLNETGLLTKGNILSPITEDQSVGIGFQLDNRFYNADGFEGNHNLDLNPYYVYRTGDWLLHLGAHVNYGFGLESKFRVAPDVDLTYSFENSYQFYARATGGHVGSDLRRIEQQNPYAVNLLPQLKNTFEQVNGSIGIKGSPADGLWFNVFGGYQDLKDDVCFNLMGSYYALFTNLTPYAGSTSRVIPLQADMHNFYGGAELDYTYKEQFNLHASGLYRSWGYDEKKSPQAELVACFKPEFEGNLNFSYKITPAANMGAGFQLITRKGDLYSKPNAVTDLYVSGSYEIFSGFSIYAKADNLLNKKYQYFAGIPAQGINFVGGISYCF